MSQNPYAAPSAPAVDPRRAAAHGDGKIDIGAALSEGWQTMTSSWATAIGGMIVAGICMMLATITLIGIPLLLPVLVWGLYALLLNLHDGEGELGDLFSGFSNYGGALVPMLIIILVSIALSLPSTLFNVAGTALESPALSGLGTLVNLVITLGVSVRLGFASFYVVDQEMGGIEALKASWAATRPNKVAVILLTVVVGLVSVAGVFAIVIGLLFTVPLGMLVFVAAYRQLEPLDEPAAPPPAYGAPGGPSPYGPPPGSGAFQ